MNIPGRFHLLASGTIPERCRFFVFLFSSSFAYLACLAYLAYFAYVAYLAYNAYLADLAYLPCLTCLTWRRVVGPEVASRTPFTRPSQDDAR